MLGLDIEISFALLEKLCDANFNENKNPKKGYFKEELMSTLDIISSILLLLSCIFIIAIVLLQDTKQGMSQTVTGASGDNYYQKNSGRTKEARMKKATNFAVVLFFVVTVIVNIVNANFKNNNASADTGSNTSVSQTSAESTSAPATTSAESTSSPTTSAESTSAE